MSRRVRRRTQRRSPVRKALQIVTAAATLLGTYAYSQDAEAAVPRILREGTRALYFNFGAGGDWHIYHRYYADYPGRYYNWSRFRLHQEFGGHFRGDASGPALAIVTQEGFLRYRGYYGYGGGDFAFQVKGKFLWDIQVKKGLGFYISPFGTVGWAGWFGDAYWACTYGYRHSATTSVGVTAKLMLDDRWVVWLQVPTVEFFFNSRDWYARFGFFTGVGVTFG